MRQLLLIFALIAHVGIINAEPDTNRRSSRIKAIAATHEWPADFPISNKNQITVCSYNTRFLGDNRQSKKLTHIVEVLSRFDIVVMQEIVAPPIELDLADGPDRGSSRDILERNAGVALLFKMMLDKGYRFDMSNEDTGPTTHHTNTSRSEWFVAFYRPEKVETAKDIPQGWLHAKRYKHPIYRRTPWAHSFRSIDGNLDFVIINVHLYPDKNGKSYEQERQKEPALISNWVDDNDEVEKDYLIVGDMNISNLEELANVAPSGYISLNNENY